MLAAANSHTHQLKVAGRTSRDALASQPSPCKGCEAALRLECLLIPQPQISKSAPLTPEPELTPRIAASVTKARWSPTRPGELAFARKKLRAKVATAQLKSTCLSWDHLQVRFFYRSTKSKDGKISSPLLPPQITPEAKKQRTVVRGRPRLLPAGGAGHGWRQRQHGARREPRWLARQPHGAGSKLSHSLPFAYMLYFALLALKGIYHYWKCFIFSRGLLQMEAGAPQV